MGRWEWQRRVLTICYTWQAETCRIVTKFAWGTAAGGLGFCTTTTLSAILFRTGLWREIKPSKATAGKLSCQKKYGWTGTITRQIELKWPVWLSRKHGKMKKKKKENKYRWVICILKLTEITLPFKNQSNIVQEPWKETLNLLQRNPKWYFAGADSIQSFSHRKHQWTLIYLLL